MTTDVIRFEENERVDLEDMLYAVDESLRGNARHAGAVFYTDPSKQRSWVIDGFALSLPITTQVQVDLGRAILAQRDGGEILYGAMVSEGDAQRIVDISTYSNGLYSIYIRFELIEGDSQSRAFWNPQGLGSEIAQTIPTRRLANWSVRVELTNPGAEWLKIGEVTVTAGIASGLTDQRRFYFEGDTNASYESGWSDDGGGNANDRNANRASYGVKDLQTFTGAMRQCIEDIKGRGLRRWWEQDIGGMNINFTDNPVEGRLAISDVWFHLDDGGGTSPRLTWDQLDNMQYDRALNQWEFWIGGSLAADLATAGLNVLGGLVVGFDAVPTPDKVQVGDAEFGLDFTVADYPKLIFNDNLPIGDCYIGVNRVAAPLVMDFYLANGLEGYFTTSGFTITGGLVVGYVATPTADQVRIGDANLWLGISGVDPFLNVDSNDYLAYDRSSNTYLFFINATPEVEINTSGMAITNGLNVGFTSTPVDDSIGIGDANFGEYFNSGNPRRVWDVGDYTQYTRSTNVLETNLGGKRTYRYSASKCPVYSYYNPQVDETLFPPFGTQKPFTTATVTIPQADLQAGQTWRIITGGNCFPGSTPGTFGVYLDVNGSFSGSASTSNPHFLNAFWQIRWEFYIWAIGNPGNGRVISMSMIRQNVTGSDAYVLPATQSLSGLDLSGSLTVTAYVQLAGGSTGVDAYTSCQMFKVELTETA